MNSVYSIAVALTILLLAGDSAADSSMHCGQKIVQTGATKVEVRNSCGEPDATEIISGLEDIKTEIWYYNLGPRKMLYILTFRGARLKKIEVDQI